ncbi:sugar kinase [Sphingomonas piscis]|uniref:Sugar kinase n=1 Tax=Sphingomonas piscis TaxID=2714943 RepID=A0A6G7YSE1_9SPHN|nr:sugar kinase [Sphingomonas piscis]QIK79649.1 sugar kinase [Sphingomonas piscis]
MLLRLNALPGVRLSQARDFQVHVGGAEANVAAGLAALGHRVEHVTVLPASALGDLCLADLRRSGIGVTHVLRTEGRLGSYFIEHGSGPRPAAIVYDRAGSAFAEHADRIAWTGLAGAARWFHLSGINLPLSSQTSASALRAVEAMSSAGIPISFDVNHRPSLWGDRVAEAARLERQMMDAAEVLFASAGDLSRALGRCVDQQNAAELAFASFPKLRYLISTRRAHRGDYDQSLSMQVHTSDGAYETEATPVGLVVDRIGSGDALAAAALDGIMRGASLQQIAEAGLAAGILKIGIAGDRWVGTRDELADFHSGIGGDVKR